MLRVSSIRKSYDVNSDPVFRDLSLQVAHHEILFLVGPSGTGKTSALRCIANLDPFDAGIITIDGKSPQQMGFSLWRRHVMYVPQHRVALRGTPADLLSRALSFQSYKDVPKNDAEHRLKEYVSICSSMGLTESNVCCQQWSELSGGQAQRATVSLCLALRPKVLLLDEPSSSCDLQSTLKMEHAIKQSNIAAVWVSHDASQPQRVGGRIQSMLSSGLPI
ncbi:unnamed protein product [Agarophyton chilense]